MYKASSYQIAYNNECLTRPVAICHLQIDSGILLLQMPQKTTFLGCCCKCFHEKWQGSILSRLSCFMASPNDINRYIVPCGHVDESLNAKRFMPSHGFKSFMRSPNLQVTLKYIMLHELLLSIKIPTWRVLNLEQAHCSKIKKLDHYINSLVINVSN